MPDTPETKTSPVPRKRERSFWSNPIAYIVVIIIAILIILGVIYFCYSFFPPAKRLPSVFYERGALALKEFSAGTVECAK